jgi:hypothetical protein
VLAVGGVEQGVCTGMVSVWLDRKLMKRKNLENDKDKGEKRKERVGSGTAFTEVKNIK